MRNFPPNAATALPTAASPTPRPLVAVTAVAVEKPEESSEKNASKDADKTNSEVNNKDKQAINQLQNRQVEYTGETKDITISH